MLVIRKSHFVSICLLAIASSIALTEYVMYTPSVSDVSEDDLFSDIDSSKDIESDSEIVENREAKSDDEASFDFSEDSGVSVGKIPFSDGNREHTVSLNSGDTIISVLVDLGFSNKESFNASKSIDKIFRLRNLKVGQEIVVFGHKNENGELVLEGIEFKPDMRYKIVVSKNDSGNYVASKEEVPIRKVMRTSSGSMSSCSPLVSLKQCGVKSSVAKEAVRALGQVVNLRSSKNNVNFEFLYADFYDDKGNNIGKPELVYASALVNGKIFRVYKFKDGDSFEYVDSNGMLLSSLAKNKSLLAKPLGRMKVTSAYGIRNHPVYGRIKRHTGVDLSAGVGTPIYSAANGRIMKACYYSGYGKYVKIRHSGSIDTAYGHLSRILVRPGQQVRQGQIIGYVGVTGVTTGPHLHYEVIQNGKFINPMSFVKRDPQKLTGKKLSKFNQFKKDVNIQVVGLTPSSQSNPKSVKIRKIS